MKKSKNNWKSNVEKSKKREYDFQTLSNKDLDLLYYPKKENEDFLKKINYPGEFPYTRGIHPNMYRGKLWTMRQFSGFGLPEETNRRYKYPRRRHHSAYRRYGGL